MNEEITASLKIINELCKDNSLDYLDWVWDFRQQGVRLVKVFGKVTKGDKTVHEFQRIVDNKKIDNIPALGLTESVEKEIKSNPSLYNTREGLREEVIAWLKKFNL